MRTAQTADADEHERGRNDRDAVERTDAEEQRGDEPAAEEHHRQTEHESDGHEPQRLAHHAPDHGRTRRAERHAKTELRSAPGDRIREDTEEAEAREAERERAESRCHQEDQAPRAHRALNAVTHRHDALDGQLGNGPGQGASQRRNHLFGRAGGPDLERTWDDSSLGQRKEHGWHRRCRQTEHPRIVHDPDDLRCPAPIARSAFR